MQPSDRTLLEHMLQYALTAQRLVGDISQDDFLSSEVLMMAAAHSLQVIGEAACRVSPATREHLVQIEWAAIIGLRHRIVHDYFGIDYAIIWQIISEELPILIRSLEDALNA